MNTEEIKLRVEKIIKEHFEMNGDTQEIDLDALGINSIDALELLIEIENDFDIEIPDEDLNAELFSSSEHISNYISGKLSEE